MACWRASLVLAAFFTLAAISTGALAQDERAPDEMTGIKVGEKAPDFKLKNFDGTEHALSDLVKKAPVALIFFRSANW